MLSDAPSKMIASLSTRLEVKMCIRDRFRGSRAAGLALAGFDGQKPVLLMTGGSLGAQSVNRCLREALPELLTRFDVLHLCGKGNLDESLMGMKGYCQKEFLSDEMPDALAVADVVLSRAGSNTLKMCIRDRCGNGYRLNQRTGVQP